jgi:membrane protease YdiL (CAAX protease family)
MFVVRTWPARAIGELVHHIPQRRIQVRTSRSPRPMRITRESLARAPNPEHQVGPITFKQAFVFQVALGAISVVLATPLRNGGALGPGFFMDRRAQLWLAVKALFPFFFVFLAMGEGIEVPKPSDSLRPMFEGRNCFHIASLCFVTAVGEELFFRGLLLGAANRLSGSVNASLAFSSVVFGLLHARSVWYATLATMAGAFLGGLYFMSGSSVLTPMVVHFLYDVAVIYLLRMRWRLKDIKDAAASVASRAVDALCSTDFEK